LDIRTTWGGWRRGPGYPGIRTTEEKLPKLPKAEILCLRFNNNNNNYYYYYYYYYYYFSIMKSCEEADNPYHDILPCSLLMHVISVYPHATSQHTHGSKFVLWELCHTGHGLSKFPKKGTVIIIAMAHSGL
jgi:hypothetical protein